MGEIEDPFTQKLVKNLPLAKQTIDLIGMLKEKTKGNLTPEEEKIMEYVLYDLRMRYVKAAANPVRNSSRCDSKPSGALNPAGIILKSNPVADSGPSPAEWLRPRAGHYF